MLLGERISWLAWVGIAVVVALGVRKSWLDRVGEPFPTTWEDVKRVAGKFRDGHPDGDPNGKTFAFALEAAKPRDLIHMLDLFTFGAGLRHTLLDPAGNITIDEPQHAVVLEEFLKTYTSYKFVAPDTINHSFAEMYQFIEGGRGGGDGARRCFTPSRCPLPR